MPLMSVMIITSDWVVALLLGPNWAGVSRIFQFLAIAGFAQPICSTTGWLFVSQGRGGDMFRWGLLGSSIIVAGIVAGLPWGATGVALSYSVTFVCVVAPVLFWFVGRAGPVRARDLYSTVAPILVASLCGLGAGAAVRVLSGVTRPVPGILYCGAAAAVTILVVLIALPGGRRGLVDLRDSVVSLI
jgi:PST family polysaccharide transporter